MAAVQFSVQLLAHFHGIATRLLRPIYTFLGRTDLPQRRTGVRAIKYSTVAVVHKPFLLYSRQLVREWGLCSDPSSPTTISMRIRICTASLLLP